MFQLVDDRDHVGGRDPEWLCQICGEVHSEGAEVVGHGGTNRVGDHDEPKFRSSPTDRRVTTAQVWCTEQE